MRPRIKRQRSGRFDELTGEAFLKEDALCRIGTWEDRRCMFFTESNPSCTIYFWANEEKTSAGVFYTLKPTGEVKDGLPVWAAAEGITCSPDEALTKLGMQGQDVS